MTRPVAHHVDPAATGAVDTITLDEIARHRRRMAMTSDGGIDFLLDLPEARLLRHGEGLRLDDGRIIAVQSAQEALYVVAANDLNHLLRLTWHLGNRHCASEIHDDRILIRRDPTMKAMLEGLGATVSEIEAPFDPEGGAYQGHHSHD